jgi:CBS domain-containing protein
MKSVTVDQVYRQKPMRALVLKQDMSLPDVLETFVSDYTLKGVFLTDEDGRLTGIINRHDLLHWARVQFDLPPSTSRLRLGRLRRLLLATRALDIASSNSKVAAVTPQETLADVLEKMVRHDLMDIPVVDDDGHILGDMHLTKLLSFVLQSDAETLDSDPGS